MFNKRIRDVSSGRRVYVILLLVRLFSVRLCLSGFNLEFNRGWAKVSSNETPLLIQRRAWIMIGKLNTW